MRWTATAALAALTMLVGCGGDSDRTASTAPPVRVRTSATSEVGDVCPTPQDIARRHDAQPLVISVTTPTVVGERLRLDPPPDGAAPAVTAADAYDSLRRTLGGDPGPHPTVGLGLFSDDGGSLVRDRLAWVFVFADTTVGQASGPPPHAYEPPCNIGRIVTAVDAQSGVTVLRVATGGPGSASSRGNDLAAPVNGRCAAEATGGAVAVASYETTVGAIRAWVDKDDVKVGDGRFADHPGTEAVTLCWYDGASIAKSAPSGADAPALDRYAAMIDSVGQSTLVVAGHHDRLPIERP